MSDYDSCESSAYNKTFPLYEKDPDATLDYQFNWAPWLSGDEIDTSSFLLPDGLTQVSASNTTTTATILVSGGETCSRYRVTNRITTVSGRVTDRTIVLAVRER